MTHAGITPSGTGSEPVEKNSNRAHDGPDHRCDLNDGFFEPLLDALFKREDIVGQVLQGRERALDDVHVIIVAAKSRVNFPTPNGEEIVRYVLHRVRTLS